MANKRHSPYNAKYHNIIISDHSPVSFSVKLCENASTLRNWGFNPQLIPDCKYCEYISGLILANIIIKHRDRLIPQFEMSF